MSNRSTADARWSALAVGLAAALLSAYAFVFGTGGSSLVGTGGHVVTVFAALGMAVCWRSTWFRPIDPGATDPFERLRGRRRDLLVIAAFAICATLYVFLDVAIGERTIVSAPFGDAPSEGADAGVVSHVADPGAGRLIEAPGLWLTARGMREEGIPLWNRHEACGTPHLANGELATLSIVQLPLNLWPSLRGWDLLVLARFAMAFFLAALWMLGLGLSVRAAMLGGAAWALGGLMVANANMTHLNGTTFLPLIFLGIDGLRSRPTIARWCLVAVAFALVLNGGNPEPPAVAALMIGIGFGWEALRRRSLEPLRALALVAFASLVGALLDAAALFPLLDLYLDAAVRPTPTLDMLRPSVVFSLIAPARSDAMALASVRHVEFWYVGAVVAGLATTAMLRRGSVEHVGRWRCCVVFVLVALLTPLGHACLDRLPFLRDMNFVKYAGSWLLFIALFAASALDRSPRGGRDAGLAAAVVLLGLAAWGAWSELVKPAMSAAAAIAACVAAVVATSGAGGRLLVHVAPLLVVMELSCRCPERPARATEPFATRTASERFLDDHRTREEGDGEIWRMTGVQEAYAPLTSSVFGWHDVRSVGALPLRDYYRWLRPQLRLAPYDHPLIASADELAWSACLDLAAVRWLVVPLRGAFGNPEDASDPTSAAHRLRLLMAATGFDTSSLRHLDRMSLHTATLHFAGGSRWSGVAYVPARNVRRSSRCRTTPAPAPAPRSKFASAGRAPR